jgi:phenylacetate-CoA ligase
MLVYIKKIYDILPKKYIKFLKYIPDILLFGRSYSQWKSKISFEKNLLNKNIYDTLIYVRKHTKFGQEHIPENISINNAKRILESLPITTSYDVAMNLEYYKSDEYNYLNSYTTTTGGTGRNPTTIVLSNELYGIEWAHVHHIWSYVGYDRKKHVKLTLRDKALKENELIEYSPLYNEVTVNVFKINDENFNLFLKMIKPYDIKYIYGYPSLVKKFMTLFKTHGGIPILNGLLLISEATSIEDKKIFSDFFGCKVLSFYGQSERALIAVDIEANGMYRVYTSYGYPRIVDGELVITSFVNRALPLVNYQIGDGAEIIEEEHYLYLKNLTSRRGKDFIYLTKEKKMSLTLLRTSNVQNEILYLQIYQNEFGKIEFRILQKSTSNMSSEQLLSILSDELKENFSEFIVNVKLVTENEIIKSQRGKMILLVQDIEI